MAALAAVDQAAVARFERGERAPTVPVLERLLAAMDVQLVIGVEPLDAHLDARIDDLAARPIAERIDGLNLNRLLDRLTDFPQVITGCAAALLQGAPVPVDALEIALRWQDAKLFTRWLETNYGQRWNARWGEFGGVWLEPEEPGEQAARRAAGRRRAAQPAVRSQSMVGRPASASALLAALNGRLPRKPRGFIGLGWPASSTTCCGLVTSAAFLRA